MRWFFCFFYQVVFPLGRIKLSWFSKTSYVCGQMQQLVQLLHLPTVARMPWKPCNYFFYHLADASQQEVSCGIFCLEWHAIFFNITCCQPRNGHVSLVESMEGEHGLQEINNISVSAQPQGNRVFIDTTF